MTKEQWAAFREAAQSPQASPPCALIVDSPWIPGFFGFSHLDYFLNRGVWFDANFRLGREFPEIIFLPSWWPEYGMAAEPSALGAKVLFWEDQPPSIEPTLHRIEDAARLKPANPLTDGCMPLTLHWYRQMRARIHDAGEITPVVAARGPLCTAGFVRGLTDFLADLVENPAAAHSLIDTCTATVIRWLEAQAEAAGPDVEGILVLDDVVGLLSKAMYREFAEPYLKRVTGAFPKNWLKIYHNDANIKPFADLLPDTGFNVLNFSHKLDAAELAVRTSGRMALMGNVAPLDLGVRGTPEAVRAEAARIVRTTATSAPLILSFGGGVSPGTPAANIHALSTVA